MEDVMQKGIVSLLLLLALLTGCGQGQVSTEKEQKLRISINRDPATMDPRKGADIVGAVMHFLLFDGLTKLDDTGEVIPALAERIDLSEDKTVYTFHLRDSIWSDGRPVTASDFETSWKKNLDPSFPCPNAHLFYAIKNAELAKKGKVSLSEVGVRALDDKTLEVVLSLPTPHFLRIISFCTFSPVSAKVDAEHPDWAFQPGEHFVTNGPFLLKSWKHNDELVFTKNPHYWNEKTVHLDTLHISIINNEMTALHMYENGELDLLDSALSPIPLDALREYISKGKLTTFPEPGTTVCFFNTERFPFTNVHMRKAFAYAINRGEIVHNITQLNETVATGPVPPVLKSNNRDFFKDNDKEAAQEHFQIGLKELGLTSPHELGEIVYNYSITETNSKVAQAIQQQIFHVLGIRIKLEQMEHKTLLDKLARRDYMAAQGLWLAQYNDQMNILERFRIKDNIKNYPGWENDEYRELVDSSNYASSTDERLELLEKAEALLVDNMPVTPLFHWSSAMLIKPYLKVASCSATAGVFFEKIMIDLEGQRMQ